MSCVVRSGPAGARYQVTGKNSSPYSFLLLLISESNSRGGFPPDKSSLKLLVILLSYLFLACSTRGQYKSPRDLEKNDEKTRKLGGGVPTAACNSYKEV